MIRCYNELKEYNLGQKGANEMGEEKKPTALMKAREEIGSGGRGMSEVKPSPLTRAREEVAWLKRDIAVMQADNVSSAKAVNEKFAAMESALTTLREQKELVEKERDTLQKNQTNYDYYKKRAEDLQQELNGLHAILDALNVPKKSNAQYPTELTITARVFAWREGIKVEKGKDE